MDKNQKKFQYNSLYRYFSGIWVDTESTINEAIDIPLATAKGDFSLINFLNYTITACLVYLYRLNSYENFSVSLCNDLDKPYPNKCFLTTELSPNLSIAKAIDSLISSLSLAATSKKITELDPDDSGSKLNDHADIGFLILKSEASFDKDITLTLKAGDVMFVVALEENKLFIYSKGALHKQLKQNLKQHIINTFSLVVDKSKKKICNFDFLSEQEKQTIMNVWNNTLYELPSLDITALFKENCLKSPNKVAVTFGNTSLTYKELDEHSDRLAHYLQSIHIKPGMFVSLLLSRSLQMLIAIIAILKIGAVYVPIETRYPIKRIKYIIQNSGSNYLISTSEFQKLINDTDGSIKVIHLDKIKKLLANCSPHYTGNHTTNKKLAYLIYTSGSTGKPKGVLISHRNIINYAYWFRNKFQFNDKSSIDFSSSIGFDLAVACTLVPLIIGATIFICDNETKIDPSQYLHYLLRHNITHIECIPDYLNHLLCYPELIKKFKKLRWILLGGDALVKKDIERWLLLNKRQNLVNEYGPTECTVAITSYLINKKLLKDLDTIPIGKPAQNTHAFILDRHQNICPVGVIGELLIGGESVSSGYLDQEKNLGKFVNKRLLTSKFKKYYNTGDLARWLPSGDIAFLGRIDNQVKINGFRIELSEVENQLLEHQEVDKCKVIAKENNRGEKLLTAYVRLNSKHTNCNFLKKYLKNYLPNYMIPAQIINVKDFPVNASGKVDVMELSALEVSKKKFDVKSLDEKTHFLIKLWEELLGHNNFTLNDNFLDTGGGSLLTVSLMLEIEKQFGIRLPLSRLSAHFTIHSLIKLIDEYQSEHLQQALCKHTIEPKMICLKESSYSESLFLIPPVGGTVFIFKSLVEHLEWDGKIFALQDPAIEYPETKFTSLESMATCYISTIKKVQAKGPYLIAGASFGATLSVEIANQLLKGGDAVNFLGLFDGWALYSNKLKDVEYFKDFMNKKISKLSSKYVDSLIKIQYEREQLLFNYKIPRVGVNLSLFKAIKLWPIFATMDTPKNCWEKFIDDSRIQVYQVGGDHESMFYAPYVRKFAHLLAMCLTSNKKKLPGQLIVKQLRGSHGETRVGLML